MNLENLGGRNLKIDLENRVFEGTMDKIHKKLAGRSPPLPLRLLRPWFCNGPKGDYVEMKGEKQLVLYLKFTFSFRETKPPGDDDVIPF